YNINHVQCYVVIKNKLALQLLSLNATFDLNTFTLHLRTQLGHVGISWCGTMVIDSPMLDGSSDSPPSRLCSVCGCSFSPQTGSAHSPAHCPSCEHSSNGRRPKRPHLTLHLASHNKERKFCCGICGKHFKQKSHLEAHRLIHTGERPFKCPECGKCFGRAAHLKTHRRIHSGEKPFQCFICGKSFTQKSGLMAHIQRHANKRLSALASPISALPLECFLA
uniref:C2H2-type domain-containing protein n=1 Tax=Periophthalmus magnuspinnatus TaxID=409849 RepID=A0A3B3Z6Q2_9GOBI